MATRSLFKSWIKSAFPCWLDVCITNKTKHVCWENWYGISLLVSSLVRCAHSGDIELTTRRAIPYLRVPIIGRMHKWRPKKYSFVFVLIRPTSLVLKQLFFCILSVQTRLVRLISTKTKEYFFGRHLCIRSIYSLYRRLEQLGHDPQRSRIQLRHSQQK